MRLVIGLAAGLVGAFSCAPAFAADLRLLQKTNRYVLFADFDARRTDQAGLMHGVTWRISPTPLPSSGAQVSRFEDVADCTGRRITTQAITGYDLDLRVVQQITPREHWFEPDQETLVEFDALCEGHAGERSFRRLPTNDWKAAAVQFLSYLQRAAQGPA